jgi:hypothetical protein
LYCSCGFHLSTKRADLEIPVAAIVLRAVPIVQLVLKIRSKKENKYD